VPRRSVVTIALALAGSAAALAYRRRSARRERVDLYLADGTRASLAAGTPGAADLLAIAHELLHA
jgi:hypothetical protein